MGHSKDLFKKLGEMAEDLSSEELGIDKANATRKAVREMKEAFNSSIDPDNPSAINPLEYTEIHRDSGHVAHGQDGDNYIYQIFPTGNKQGLDLTPALEKIFSGISDIEVFPPEPEFPGWTVRLIKAALNPWLESELTKDFPNQLADLLT